MECFWSILFLGEAADKSQQARNVSEQRNYNISFKAKTACVKKIHLLNILLKLNIEIQTKILPVVNIRGA